MSFFSIMNLVAGGLEVQRARMEIVSDNMSNVSTTRTEDGGPYRKKSLMVTSEPMPFETTLAAMSGRGAVEMPRIAGVQETESDANKVYDPAHPDADASGFVVMPDVNLMEEMINMMTASRAYEASITAFNTAKGMAMQTLDIGSA